MTFTILYSIYIPHWLDSMWISKSFKPFHVYIYIPHWLDSMAYVLLFKGFKKGFTFHTG